MKILFIPSVEKGNGTGHLKRCIKYVLQSSEESYLYIPDDLYKKQSENRDFCRLTDILLEKKILKTVLDSSYDVIVTDKRKTSAEEYRLYKSKSNLLVGLDEGGENRKIFSYLIDTLPSLSDHSPNIFSTGLLGIKYNCADPENLNNTEDGKLCHKKETNCKKKYENSSKKISNKKIENILISFGGEDPENLSDIILKVFSEDNDYKHIKIRAVKGPLFENILENWRTAEIIDSPDSLETYISETDLVITSFGITAYEALYADKYVILLNPSVYHSDLSLKAGFPEIGIKSADKKLLKEMIFHPAVINEKTTAYPCKRMDLNRVISGIHKSGIEKCPFCGGINSPLKRFHDRNYYRCSRSSLIYMERFCSDNTDYGLNYFFDDYKKQYGKTYLEDFENIKKMSHKRLQIIKQYIKSGTLLDIGCAYGPFLKAADEAGYIAEGMDVSGDAVKYVNNELGIKAYTSDFSEEGKHENVSYDIVTMWYVIEHFKNPEKVLDKVKSILPEGGILAFSTPNYEGISGKTNADKTLLRSPDDHYTFWSIKSAEYILKKNGFKILKINNTGHHPERFKSKIKKIIPFTVLKYVSFLLKLGDTFEIYAMKK